jgi:hypothetical protein
MAPGRHLATGAAFLWELLAPPGASAMAKKKTTPKEKKELSELDTLIPWLKDNYPPAPSFRESTNYITLRQLHRVVQDEHGITCWFGDLKAAMTKHGYVHEDIAGVPHWLLK